MNKKLLLIGLCIMLLLVPMVSASYEPKLINFTNSSEIQTGHPAYRWTLDTTNGYADLDSVATYSTTLFPIWNSTRDNETFFFQMKPTSSSDAVRFGVVGENIGTDWSNMPYMISFNYDGTGVRIYEKDDSNNAVLSTGTISWSYRGAVRCFKIVIDETKGAEYYRKDCTANEEITDTGWTLLYDSTPDGNNNGRNRDYALNKSYYLRPSANGYDAGSDMNFQMYQYIMNIDVESEAETGNIDILVTNTSTWQNNNKTNFKIGENFYTYVNWSQTNTSILTDSDGECNYTVYNATNEYDGSGQEVIMTTTTWTENYTSIPTTNSLTDTFHLNLCHEQLAQGDVLINVTCNSGFNETTLTSSLIPSCNGNNQIFITDSTCKDDENVSITFTTNVIEQRRKNLSNVQLDREFSLLEESMVYNSTDEVWYPITFHEYYDVATESIYASCVHDSDNNLSVNTSQEITITANAPVIFPSFITNDLGDYTINEAFNQIQYADNSWQWYGSAISTNPLDKATMTIYNGTGSQVFTQTVDFTAVPPPTYFETSDELFANFENNYTVVWIVNDTTGLTSNTSTIIEIIDTINPVILVDFPLNNSNHQSGVISFDATCTDEHIGRVNATVFDNNGSVVYSEEFNGIDAQSYRQQFELNVSQFSTSMNESDYHYVIWTCADTHTKNDLQKDWNAEKEDLYTYRFSPDGNEIKVVIDDDKKKLKTAEFRQLNDRFVFDITTKSEINELKFKVYADYMYYPNSEFDCHAVLYDNYWIDFEFDKDSTCTANLNGDYYTATVTFFEASNSFTSNSVGEVNVINQTTYFSTFDTSSLVVDFTGIVCGEKYPDNNLVLNITDSLTNCTIRVNGELHHNVIGSCTDVYNLTTDFGRNEIEITGINSYGNEIESVCNVWTNKQDKTIADYFYILLLIGLVFALLWAGTYFNFFWVACGIICMLLGFSLFVFHWAVASIVMLLGFIIIFLPMFNS